MKVGYARVSTRDQNPTLQTAALEEAGCERIYHETASGAQRDRPELMAAIDFLREGDVLVVWKLDRLARSTRQLIETIEALEARRIGFRSLTEAMDTTTPGGKLIFTIFGALAEFERSVIRERTAAGLAEARKQGRKGGRPPALSPSDRAAVQALLRAEPPVPLPDILRRYQLSQATFYRYFPGGRERYPTTRRPGTRLK